MKIQSLILLATTLVSLQASAWFVDRVSCKQNNDSNDPSKTTYTSITNLTITNGTYSGTYATKTEINPRHILWGLDIIKIYDGMNLEGGQITLADGTTMNSRAEIRFKPFTDKAYGPDYATVAIYTIAPGQSSWSAFESFNDCYVSVSH